MRSDPQKDEMAIAEPRKDKVMARLPDALEDGRDINQNHVQKAAAEA